MLTNTAEKLFSSTLNFVCMDEKSIERAQERFLETQKSGATKQGCCFEDEIWYTTDEYSNVGLHFVFNVFAYRQYEVAFGLSFNEFVSYVKVFLISLFGRNTLSTMQSVLLDLRHVIETDKDAVYGASEELKISLPMLCSDFFTMLPADNEEIEWLINSMDTYAEFNLGAYEKRQRILADFDTYFRFDEIIKDYWRTSMPKEERLFYYPLYLWWMITGVLPLRPREFLLTERDCLSKDTDGAYHLRLRRNRLKGSRREVAYKLADDYTIDTYKIPNYLGEEIQRYLDFTEGYERTEIETLFVTDPHYRKWEQSKHSNSRYLTYMNMNTILKYFFNEIVCEKYGLKVVHEQMDRHLAEGEIGFIHLGDTRHIALINLMQEGGTPVTAMLLAGHNNAITASHYYSNLTNLIECRTYRQYRRLAEGGEQYQISVAKELPQVGIGTPVSGGGKCYSEAYAQGGIEDCVLAVGENGEIGYCPSCTFYRTIGAYFSDDRIYKRNLKADCEALKTATELVRQGKGSVEDIGEALLRIRSSSVSYEAYLVDKHRIQGVE